MKKPVLFLLTLCLCLGLTGCGGPSAQSSGGQSGATSGSSQSNQSDSQQPAQSDSQQSDQSSETSEDSESPRGILSQFSTQDLEGNELDQSMLQDHTLTMVNVWATFCTPCISEMPDLGTLAQEYADQGVQIVGLVSDVLDMEGNLDPDQLDLAREIVDSTAADYTHLVPSEDLYGLLYQISSVPTTFFVDETGAQVGGTYIGAKDKDQWQDIIDQLLAEVDA